MAADFVGVILDDMRHIRQVARNALPALVAKSRMIIQLAACRLSVWAVTRRLNNYNARVAVVL